jgi:hypothetical protein
LRIGKTVALPKTVEICRELAEVSAFVPYITEQEASFYKLNEFAELLASHIQKQEATRLVEVGFNFCAVL